MRFLRISSDTGAARTAGDRHGGDSGEKAEKEHSHKWGEYEQPLNGCKRWAGRGREWNVTIS